MLKRYEEIPGQLINTSKSFFYLHEKTPLIYTVRLRKLTGINQGNFPFTYLGCPVYYGRKMSAYFEDIIRKLFRRIFSWQNRFLSIRFSQNSFGEVQSLEKEDIGSLGKICVFP